MNKDFWHKLPRPLYVLAPMANVTDSVFRGLFAKYGKPDVTWTEFVSADGLCSPGRARLLVDLKYSPKERPIVAQLFTGHPEPMKKAAALARKLGFDGLDINMGCPVRLVDKQGGGAALIKEPKAALAVLAAAREGFKGPVSVKTRIGYNKVDLEWIRLLLNQKLPALTVHLRTRKEMSDCPAHWELMPEIVRMRDEIQAELQPAERTLIIGNGDVVSLADGAAKCAETGCDGVMIGRGIFGAPWFFEDVGKFRKKRGAMSPASLLKSVESFDTFEKSSDRYTPQHSPAERLKILLEHTRLFEKTYCGKKHLKNFAVMKKHFKAYVSGWDGAKELRAKLMETENYAQVAKIIKEAHVDNPLVS